MAVILPPKIYFYEPKISGFKIAGKRGSKYFQPPKGNMRIVEDSMQSMELEMFKKKQAQDLADALDSKLNLDISK